MSAMIDAAGADREALAEHGVQAGDEVDAGDHHGGGVDQRRHRGGTGHGVGQPGVQRELAALAHDADEAGTTAPTSSSVWSAPGCSA